MSKALDYAHVKPAPMSEDKALEYVASMLAIRCAEHLEDLKDFPELAQNTEQLIGNCRGAANALGIGEVFLAKLALHMSIMAI